MSHGDTTKPLIGEEMGDKDLNVYSKGLGILVEDGLILSIADSEELISEYAASWDRNSERLGDMKIIDANGGAIVPGFVDSHTHLIWDGDRSNEMALRQRGLTYSDISKLGGGITKTVESTRSRSIKELVKLGAKRASDALRLGTTTMEAKSGYGLSTESELKLLEATERVNQISACDIQATWLGAHDIPKNNNKEEYIEIKTISEKEIEKSILEGKIDSVMTISKDFSLESPNLEISFENSKEKIAQEFYDLSEMIISDLLNNNQTEKSIVLKEKIFENQYQGYKGFLVPGIVALSIMQSGILGVVFTLISYKTQGVLKRLQATPIDPSHFLIGQMISRLLIIVIQTFILFLIGTLILNIDIALGSIYAWINIIIFSVLGSILFLFIGLAVSGASPNEDYAAPIANLITFPMMFLSGVFFDTDVFPSWLSVITDNLPLSPLVNSLRESALYGTHTFELLPELAIMLVWIVLAFIIGIKTFKWE